jgi:uncharacterized protein YkwD
MRGGRRRVINPGRVALLFIAGGTLMIAGGLFVQGAFGASSTEMAPALAQDATPASKAGLNPPPAAPLDPTATSTPEPSSTEAPPVPTDVPPTEVPPTEAPTVVVTAAPTTAPPTRAPAAPTAVPPTPASAPPQAVVGLRPFEQAMFDSHNTMRSNAGLTGVTIDARLVEVARRRAQDMAAKNYFAHTSPTGETAFTILEEIGYAYKLAGENIARNNYPDPETVQVSMTGFMNSPSHRSNILEPAYRRVGIGFALGADGMKYFAVVFSN